MPTENMWSSFDPSVKKPTPFSILDAQADKLSEMTGFRLNGNVEAMAQGTQMMNVDFYVESSRLPNYKLHIITATYPLTHLYPVDLRDRIRGSRFECGDEATFVHHLGEILGSVEIGNALTSLMSHTS